MLGRHRVEGALARGRQPDELRAPVAGNRAPLDQPFGDQSWSVMPVTLPPVTISRRDSSPILRPSRIALELRHEVEARQRGREALAQARAHPPLDQIVQVSSRSHSRSES